MLGLDNLTNPAPVSCFSDESRELDSTWMRAYGYQEANYSCNHAISLQGDCQSASSMQANPCSDVQVVAVG